MHTDSSISLLESATKQLGSIIRRFAKHTCTQFDTQELPHEAAARGSRKKRKQRRGRPQPAASSGKPPPPPPKRKLFNLITYKLHALGDYVAHILLFGTTDSYSTQRVRLHAMLDSHSLIDGSQGELEHRRVKKFYVRTNKIRPAFQISQLELRERALRRKARTAIPQAQQPVGASKRRKARPLVDFAEKEPLPMTLPEVHHHIARARRFRVDIIPWLDSCSGDPLTTVCVLNFTEPQCLTALHRTFTAAFRIIFLSVSLNPTLLLMITGFMLKSACGCGSRATPYTHIRSCA